MSRHFSLLAFAVPALALFLFAAWMVINDRRPGVEVAGVISQGGVSLKSTKIDLPVDEPVLPGGAASDIVTNSCTACHSVEMIEMQPPLDAKTWAKEVDKMRATFHAVVDPKDDPAIIKALLALPTQRPVPAARIAPRPARRP